MKLDKHVVDMFAELTKPADDVKMEKTCYGTISVVDGTRYVKLDGSDLLVPAASTVKTSHGDRVTVLMKNHSLTVTGNLTAPATDGEGGSSGEAGTAATIEVGTVTTGEAGSSASVTNSGTTSAAVFDFIIPRGDKGEKGDTGPQGPQGEKGDTGTWDGTIPEHEHAVSDITDFPDFVLNSEFNAHAGNAEIHVTAEEKTSWNNKAELSDIPSSLPAAGGNAATLGNIPASELERVRTAIIAGEAAGFQWTAMQAKKDDTMIRVQVDADYDRVLLFKSIDGGVTWTEIPLGNADTLDGKHANEIASNPNQLDNPNFKINQRGMTEYADAGIYCVDRWRKCTRSTMTVTKLSSGISFSSNNVHDANWMAQKFEETTFTEDTAVTLSVCAKGSFGITYYGDGMHNFAADDYTIKSLTYIIPAGKRFGTDISYCPLIGLSATGEYAEFLWAKLELGSIATPFIPPDPATELLKCQRYYQRYYANEMPNALRVRDGLYSIQMNIPNMRATPAVRYHWRFGNYDNILKDGNDAPHTAVFTTSAYNNYRTVRIVINTDASTPTGYLPADENSYCELESEI